MRGTTRARGGSSSRRASRRHRGSQLVASTTDTPRALSANHAADALLERLLPEDLDLRGGAARVRLALRGGDEVDVVLGPDGNHVEEADGKPDALLRADQATWERV